MQPLEDHHWLTSAQGRELIELVRQKCDERGLLAIADQRRLQSRFPANLVGQAHDLLLLRRKAASKFACAEEMFLTAKSLEQASDQAIGAYKASRFPQGGSLADLCCGIGGDLIPLAKTGSVCGVEADPRLAEFARANLAANSAAGDVLQEDAAHYDVGQVDAWHIDPDRRLAGRKTTQVDSFSPSWSEIVRLLALNPNASLKLAAASRIPQLDSIRHVRQWIGNARECRQQVIWCGDLSTVDAGPVRHQATLAESNREPVSIEGSPDLVPDIRQTIGRYFYDPHSVVLASHLLGVIAHAHGLATIAAGAVYLTGDDQIETPFLRGFEVLEHAPFDRKRWRQLLRDRKIGRLEIKKRGVDIDPETVRRQMKLRGDKDGVLIIMRQAEQVQGVLAKPLLLTRHPQSR